jgi:hypothetical protein
MKYARLEGNYVAQVLSVDPLTIYAEWYAALFVSCPDAVQVGWIWNGTEFIESPPVPTLVDCLTKLKDFLSAHRDAEKLAWINAITQANGWPQTAEAWDTMLANMTWPAHPDLPTLPE